MNLSQTNPLENTRAQRIPWDLLISLVPPLLFVTVMALYFPFRAAFELDPDEGVNAMKSLLLLKGYPLYDSVWSDQPPLFTYLLATAYRILDPGANVGRFLVLLFSGALVWAVFRFLHKTWGLPHAAAGVILLVLVPDYLNLSVSTMIGLPAIALAALAMSALGAWHRTQHPGFLVLSALLLALSLMTKLFTAFLTPVFLVGILTGEAMRLRGRAHPLQALRSTWKADLRPALLWSLVLGVVLLTALLIMIGPANLYQLIVPHLEADLPAFLGDQPVEEIITYSINDYLKPALLVLLLAVLGLIATLRTRRWAGLYPAAWMAGAYLLLTFHDPVWYHHSLLVTVPAAVLAGAAVGEALGAVPALLSALRRRWAGALFVAAALGLAALTLAVRLPLVSEQFERVDRDLRTFQPVQGIMTTMQRYADVTKWVVTDLPSYAFFTGKASPPELAVITSKRYKTGELSEDEIIAVIEKYRPEQVLVGRFKYNGPLIPYLQEHYKLVFQQGRKQLYLREDVELREDDVDLRYVGPKDRR